MPRWKIWVTNSLSLTVFLLISVKSLASYLISSVLTPPDSLLDFWMWLFLLLPVLGVNQPAPSVVSSECYWSSAMLKNEMEIMFIPLTLRQLVKKFSVLGDEYLELLIIGRQTMEKRKKKLGLRGVLLSGQESMQVPGSSSFHGDLSSGVGHFSSGVGDFSNGGVDSSGVSDSFSRGVWPLLVASTTHLFLRSPSQRRSPPATNHNNRPPVDNLIIVVLLLLH